MRLTIIKAVVKVFVSTLLLSLFSFKSFAAIESYEFANDTQRDRYQHFIEDMRCPKCQNQNLANSDSPISADLRRVIYEQIRAGRSDSEITDFMVSRYGDFILYNPRVTSKTYGLWLTPLVLVILGVLVIVMVLRNRRKLAASSTQLNSDEQKNLNDILSTHAEEKPMQSTTSSVDEAIPDAAVKATTKKPAAKKVTSKTVETKTVTDKKPAAPKKTAAVKKPAKTVKPKTAATATTKAPAQKAASTAKTAKAVPKTSVTKPAAKAATKTSAKAVAAKVTTKTTTKKS